MQGFIYATCVRTAMVGGGTAYDVYWRTEDKPSRPLHGYTYATVVCRDNQQFYRTEDAIDPKERWGMEQGWEKWDAHKRLEKIAKRLDIRVARRAFPELKKAKGLPSLWAGYSLPSKTKQVKVMIQLPE